MDKHLLCIGYGYSARALRQILPEGWRVAGTTRNADRAAQMRTQGVSPVEWADLPRALEEASHVLISAGPGADGDPFLTRYRDAITAQAARLQWVGYLSTTGVYGDHQGGWVTEDTPLTPSTQRGRWRVAAETDWRAIPGLPLHIFRLAGIYGPGRGPFAKVRAGTARRIIKEGQVFSRIHVEDIAQVLMASIHRPDPGAAYNVCDDDPAPPQDVIAEAARLLGLPIPEAVDFTEADMTQMARSFYAESKRVDNSRIKTELGVRLIYPDYRAGLRALLRAE